MENTRAVCVGAGIGARSIGTRASATFARSTLPRKREHGTKGSITMSAAEHSTALTVQEVTHVAKLSRLALEASRVESMRTQLSSILGHIHKLQALDTEGVETMAHPMRLVNRLAEDLPSEGMPVEALLRNAPAVEGRFLAVPKVLGEGGGA